MKMKRMKQLGILGALTLCILMGVFFVRPIQAEAAGTKIRVMVGGMPKVKAGKYYLWWRNDKIYSSKSKTGKGEVLSKGVKEVSSNILVDGSTVYYCGQVRKGFSHIYSVRLDGKNRKLLGKGKGVFQIRDYYNGSLYLDNYPEDMAVKCNSYRINAKAKKMKLIQKDAFIGPRYKQWVLLPDDDAVGCRVYNSKTGKSVRVSERAVNGCLESGKVYYQEELRGGGYQLRSCSLAGKNKKTVMKKCPGELCGATSRYLYFRSWNSGDIRYTRYDMKTKKSQKISKKTYDKAMRTN